MAKPKGPSEEKALYSPPPRDEAGPDDAEPARPLEQHELVEIALQCDTSLVRIVEGFINKYGFRIAVREAQYYRRTENPLPTTLMVNGNTHLRAAQSPRDVVSFFANYLNMGDAYAESNQ